MELLGCRLIWPGLGQQNAPVPLTVDDKILVEGENTVVDQGFGGGNKGEVGKRAVVMVKQFQQ